MVKFTLVPTYSKAEAATAGRIEGSMLGFATVMFDCHVQSQLTTFILPVSLFVFCWWCIHASHHDVGGAGNVCIGSLLTYYILRPSNDHFNSYHIIVADHQFVVQNDDIQFQAQILGSITSLQSSWSTGELQSHEQKVGECMLIPDGYWCAHQDVDQRYFWWFLKHVPIVWHNENSMACNLFHLGIVHTTAMSKASPLPLVAWGGRGQSVLANIRWGDRGSKCSAGSFHEIWCSLKS